LFDQPVNPVHRLRDPTHKWQKVTLEVVIAEPRASEPDGRTHRVVDRAGKAAGLPFPLHVHMLRHSTGYALAARGMDTRRLQHFLGHASITNTERYTAMSPEPFKDIWR
jgi:site-specific recombinase XerD